MVYSALNVDEWVVLTWSRKSNLRLAEIESYVCLVSFEDGKHRSVQDYIVLFLM